MLLLASDILAQKTYSDTSITIPMVYFQYGYQWPGSDMADQFGGNNVIGGGFQVKGRHNWIVGAEYNFMFGPNVNSGVSILDSMMTPDGIIIAGDGLPGSVVVSERGHIGSLSFGKLFPLNANKNSGLFVTIGLGVLTHKIKIEVQNNNIPQLSGDYKRGYDRLTAAFQLNQTVGYMYFGKRNIANLTISFEVYEGFATGQRDYLFDTRQPGNTKSFDLLFGPKISWMIPFRKRGPQEFYYY